MEQVKVWINGRFFNERDARISVFDRGFLYGDGVFETMRSYDGRIFRLDEHMDRLSKALGAVGIKRRFTKSFLEDAIYKTIKTNRLRDAYARLSITRGEGRFGIAYKDDFFPNIVIMAKKFEGYPAWMHDRGIRARVVGIRQNEYSVLSNIKSMNFLNYILARMEAKRKGADEAILVNTKGSISEAATSNIFLVKKKVLKTPALDSGALPGITRNVVMDIAKDFNVKVLEKQISVRELLESDEVFLTNSLAEILPVVRINSKRIGRGEPGIVTNFLYVEYRRHVSVEKGSDPF